MEQAAGSKSFAQEIRDSFARQALNQELQEQFGDQFLPEDLQTLFCGIVRQLLRRNFKQIEIPEFVIQKDEHSSVLRAIAQFPQTENTTDQFSISFEAVFTFTTDKYELHTMLLNLNHPEMGDGFKLIDQTETVVENAALKKKREVEAAAIAAAREAVAAEGPASDEPASAELSAVDAEQEPEQPAQPPMQRQLAPAPEDVPQGATDDGAPQQQQTEEEAGKEDEENEDTEETLKRNVLRGELWLQYALISMLFIAATVVTAPEFLGVSVSELFDVSNLFSAFPVVPLVAFGVVAVLGIFAIGAALYALHEFQRDDIPLSAADNPEAIAQLQLSAHFALSAIAFAVTGYIAVIGTSLLFGFNPVDIFAFSQLGPSVILGMAALFVLGAVACGVMAAYSYWEYNKTLSTCILDTETPDDPTPTANPLMVPVVNGEPLGASAALASAAAAADPCAAVTLSAERQQTEVAQLQ